MYIFLRPGFIAGMGEWCEIMRAREAIPPGREGSKGSVTNSAMMLSHLFGKESEGTIGQRTRGSGKKQVWVWGTMLC